MLSIFSGFMLTIIFLILLINNLIYCGRIDWSIEKNAQFWKEQGRISIEEALKRRENTRIAKNIIMFLGDGMGVTTVTAGRIRKGQVNGELGEDFVTEMEQFPHLGLAKTYVYYLNLMNLKNNYLDIILIIKHLIQQQQQQLIYVVLKLN
jgi:hypothetical protein